MASSSQLALAVTLTAAEITPAAKERECAADEPDFAIICAFLEKFARDVGVDLPNFKNLQEWLTNTDEVSQHLRDLHIKLLRKTRKTVHEKSWESALSKFCFTYSAQDAWEIERFGYKKSSLKVKLRILRQLLESQFERNNKFRTKLLTLSADSLRSQPIGRDNLGNTYWFTQDGDCNLRIYQEHLDEEIWRVVASNRDELVNLISRLRGNEVVLPLTDIGVIDEDTSSSNSCAVPVERPPPPEEQEDDSQEEPSQRVPNLRIKLGGSKKFIDQDDSTQLTGERNSLRQVDVIKDEIKEEVEETQAKTAKRVNKKDAKDSEFIDESNKKVKPLIISQSQIGVSSPAAVSGCKKRSNSIENSSSPFGDEINILKRPRPSLLDSRRTSKPSKYIKGNEDEISSSESELDEEEVEEEDIDSAAAEEDENEEKEIEEYDDDFEVGTGEAIEDPPVYVRGNGTGKECDVGNVMCEAAAETELYLNCIEMNDSTECGEPIEEPVLYISGSGFGSDCFVGNENTENTSSSQEPKAKFFFGEPGCLKLSPIKLVASNSQDLDEMSKAIEHKSESVDENTEAEAEKTGTEKSSHEHQKTSQRKIDLDKPGNSNSLRNEAKKSEKVENTSELNGDGLESNEMEKNACATLEPRDKNKNIADTTTEIKLSKAAKVPIDTKTQSDQVKDTESVEIITKKDIISDKDVIRKIAVNKKDESVLSPETEKLVQIDVAPQCEIAVKQSLSELQTDLQTENLSESKASKPMKEKSCEKIPTNTDQEKELCDTPATSAANQNLNTTANSSFQMVPSVVESAASMEPTIKKSTLHSVFNRKRRLVDLATAPFSLRQSTSESDLDPYSDQQEEQQGEQETIDDIGGKRLKMRPKCTNTEIRKKVEAQLGANVEETTSSSGEEESRQRRKAVTPKAKSIKDEVSGLREKTDDIAKRDDVPSGEKGTEAIVAPVTVAVPATTSTSAMGKHKPTLSEIIEKKLKKTPPKLIASPDFHNEHANIESIFPPPKKSPITKPLKKNLLTQLRESDEEAVPRKLTISDAGPVSQCIPAATVESTHTETDATSSKEEIDTNKCISQTVTTSNRKTPERQRKRQSSEEPATKDSEPTFAVIKSNGNTSEPTKKCKDASLETTFESAKVQTEIAKAKTTKAEVANVDEKQEGPIKCPTSVSKDSADSSNANNGGRRSSRRGAGSVVYAELPKPKRTRAVAKTTPKKENASEIALEKFIAVETNLKPTELDPVKMEDKSEVEVPVTPIKGKSKNESKELNKPKSTPTVAKNSNKRELNSPVAKEDATKDDAKMATTGTNISSLDSGALQKSTTPGSAKCRGPRKKREVDTTNIIDSTDAEAPVRQSRRIAQQKIREEAERRKLEEIALRTMKQELKKKKKAEKEADPTVVEPSEHSSSSEDEMELETKKKSKKKCPGKDGWSSGSEEQEEPEEEDEDPPHYETDPGSPLFKSDHEFSPESELEDETQVVPMKRARTARKEDAEDSGDSGDEEACQKCGKSDHPEWILLCDKCDKGYHCSCLSPVLFYIPEGNWYCPPCQQEQLIVALEKQLQEFDQLVECKRIAHEEEKRLAEQAERQEQERLKEEELQKKERRKHKQKKRHRGSGDENGSTSSDHENENNADEDAESNRIKSENDDEDEDSADESKILKVKNKNSSKKADGIDKSKRRRGDGRNRRRRAAKRGTRRRRRLDQGSDSASGSVSSRSNSTDSSESDSSSSSFSDSDDEPIYKLRKRRQINVSYRLNEYDDLINSALKKEMDEVAGAGNLGRGKDITTIIEADKEEKARLKQIEEKGNGEDVAEEESQKTEGDVKSVDTKNKAEDIEEDSDDDKPLKTNAKQKMTTKKKSRKLTTLDISSEEDDASDEDFKTSSLEDEEEDEDTSISVSTDSDTSLEVFRRRGKGGKKKQRKAARRAARERRKDRRFVVDDSDDDEVLERLKSKKKRKDDSEYTESETDDDDDVSELSENVDSADLCDDTTSDDSDGAWNPSKRKKQRKSKGGIVARKSPKVKKQPTKKPKRLEYSDDDISESEEDEDEEADGGGKGSGKQPRSQPLIPVSSKKSSNVASKGKGDPISQKKPKKKPSEDELSFSDSGDSTRRTRGRRYAYIEDFEDDSSDGGIKPGVKRPDTPPEEREKFIKKQEEIKRMLAEKNAEGAKLAATPRLTPIKAMGSIVDKDKRSPAKPGQDSLSTVPLSVIRQAKVLDIDYLQRKGETVGDLENVEEDVDSEFDDADLPDDLPEDMDEDAIARMVEEEEEFGAAAARELPAPDEVLRTPSKSKTKDVTIVSPANKPAGNPSLDALSQMQGHSHGAPISIPTPTHSGLQEPMRKRLPMPTIHPPLLRHQYPPPPHTQAGNIMLHGVTMPRHPPPTHLLQSALSAPLGQSLSRNFPIQPGPHNPHLMPARQPLPPTPVAAPRDLTSGAQGDTKPRGRRKKITPLRDPIQKQATVAATAASSASVVKTTAPDLGSVRASAVVTSGSSVIKSSVSTLSIAQPPQLYKPAPDAGVGGETQTSVITRMPHLPPSRMIFPGSDVARFYSALSPPARQLSPNAQRPHRGPPLQMPAGLPPPPMGASAYGPPHPRHAPPHLNPYRPPIYGSPNYVQPRSLPPTAAPNIRLGTAPGPTGPEYMTGARPYGPYGYYPPPPPLTAAHHPAPASSVIVVAPPSTISIPPTASPSSNAEHATRESKSPIGRDPTPAENKPTPEPRKKLMTLDVYSPPSAKSPVAIGGGESSGSQPETIEDSSSLSTAQSQAKAGEFSGLVSYFSSQHDDYNT